MNPTSRLRFGRAFQAAALAAVLAAAFGAAAETLVKDAWVRGTVPQQKATGAFMQLSSSAGGKLVSVASPVAGIVEIHQMSMDGAVMRMRAIATIDLPAGQTVQLKPGGYHVMLMDLKRELKPGDAVPLTLVVESAGGQRETVEVKAAVRPLAAAVGDSAEHKKH